MITEKDLNNIKHLANKFKEEMLPDAETPYHHEAEGWATMKQFLNWLESK